MKKQHILFLAVLSPFILGSAQGAERWGFGAILGRPTALTAKTELNSTHAIDFGFGYSWGNSFLLYGDYLYLIQKRFSTESKVVNEFVPYVGFGPMLEIYDTGNSKSVDGAALSARVPLGLSWNITDSPVQLFAEIVPVLQVVPSIAGGVCGGIGGRFFF